MDRRVVRKAVQRVLLTLVLERCSSKVESLSEEYAALIKEWAVSAQTQGIPWEKPSYLCFRIERIGVTSPNPGKSREAPASWG